MKQLSTQLKAVKGSRIGKVENLQEQAVTTIVKTTKPATKADQKQPLSATGQMLTILWSSKDSYIYVYTLIHTQSRANSK